MSGIENDVRPKKKITTRRQSFGAMYAIGKAVSSGRANLVQNRPSPKPSPLRQTPPLPRQGNDPPRRINHVAAAYYGPKASVTPASSNSTMTGYLSSSSAASGNDDYFGESWTSQSTNPAETAVQKDSSAHYSTTRSPGTMIDRPRDAFASKSVSPEEKSSSSRIRKPGHNRQRGRPAKDSTDTTTGSSVSSIRSDRSRGKSHRSPTQKTMLARALTKANTAVLLDNAQNFEGAVEAYVEACDLLQQVMARSGDLDDRKKLSTIRATYSNRIKELRTVVEPSDLNKALPDRPSDDDVQESYYEEEEEELPVMSSDHSRMVNGVAIPPRLESMLPTIGTVPPALPSPKHVVHQQILPSRMRAEPAIKTSLAVPMQAEYMPPPLSPRRPLSPSPDLIAQEQSDAEEKTTGPHDRKPSTETTSWLDVVDESASSHSGHSHLSSLDFNAGLNDNLLSEIQAGFDAALNAAVDAAYDEDREKTPVAGIKRPVNEPASSDSPSQTNLREDVRSVTTNTEPVPRVPPITNTTMTEFDEDDEEERLLDEMTQGYGLEGFYFDNKSKSALPRQSDSSSFSGRTWGSSVASTTMTAGTTLSTLAEGTEIPTKQKSPLHSPMTSISPSLPILSEVPPVPTIPAPPTPSSRPPSMEKTLPQGVRDRRLSGQNAKQLKIETFAKSPVTNQGPLLPLAALPRFQMSTTDKVRQQPPVDPVSTSTVATAPATPMTSIHSADSMTGDVPVMAVPVQSNLSGSAGETTAVPPSPGRSLIKGKSSANVLRKNMSSSSLQKRNLSVNTTENTDSPITPGSATFPGEARRPYVGIPPPIPTPNGMSFHLGNASVGGMYLFDDQIGVPTTPGTPRTPNMAPNVPWPLEPCPESFLLRPFWLMRTLYQTMSHPRGGYLTTRLFVPRDVWKVKNVKLKAVDEKVSQCDLLTAALLKLSNVDQLDADAVYTELQAFETVMDQVRVFLNKKLSGDVGLAAASSLFKGSPSTDLPPEALDLKNGNNSLAAKNSLASSWRKLRSKSSGSSTTMNSYPGIPPNRSDYNKSSASSMSTVLMTPSINSNHHTKPSSRGGAAPFRRPPPATINFTGIGALSHYMASLVKLFDSVQILDQIARQVEDPGLKHSSQTHVGLELSIRAAAEFFAFYVLRFVVTDIGVLVDKFVKRGGEWVMG